MKQSYSVIVLLGISTATLGQTAPLERNGQTIMIEPYAPNVVRVTLSMIAGEATAGPGYGFLAKPDQGGWTHSVENSGADVYKSPRMTVTVAPAYRHNPNDKMQDTANFFSGSVSGTNVSITLPDGSPLAEMNGWQMAALNQKDDTLRNARGILPQDLPLYTVGASFKAAEDEHYYGLGQNQEGYLDHRQRPITCAANYLAAASPSYCVPFLVTNKGYGIVWDNPSSTTIYPAFDGETRWTSTVGRRVSFFVIAGRTTDEIYEGYRLLTGTTPMLPKAAYGFIQCKQRYSSQAEVLAVAKGYRDRHLPLDVIVVDWFYYTKMGECVVGQRRGMQWRSLGCCSFRVYGLHQPGLVVGEALQHVQAIGQHEDCNPRGVPLVFDELHQCLVGIGERCMRRVQHVVKQDCDRFVRRGQREIGEGVRRQVEIERLLRCACSSAVVYIEEVERLNHSVLQDFEVVLFQAFHWVTLGVGHDDVHDHAPNLYRELMRGRLRGLGICNGGRFSSQCSLGELRLQSPNPREKAQDKRNGPINLGHFSHPRRLLLPALGL